MKKSTRHILIILLSIIAIIVLALEDITSYGKLTTGFLGMTVMLLGSILIPTIVDIHKEKKKVCKTSPNSGEEI